MDLTVIMLAAGAAWTAILSFAVALCRAAALGDRRAIAAAPVAAAERGPLAGPADPVAPDAPIEVGVRERAGPAVPVAV